MSDIIKYSTEFWFSFAKFSLLSSRSNFFLHLLCHVIGVIDGTETVPTVLKSTMPSRAAFISWNQDGSWVPMAMYNPHLLNWINSFIKVRSSWAGSMPGFYLLLVESFHMFKSLSPTLVQMSSEFLQTVLNPNRNISYNLVPVNQLD